MSSEVTTTAHQAARIETIRERLGAAHDDVRIAHAPDLPSGWIAVTIGERKGRPKIIDIPPRP